MKRFTEIISGSAAMLFQAALTGWMFCLAKINSDFAAMSLNYLPLCAVLLLAYYLDRLMLNKAVPGPVFAIAQIIFIALGAWVFTQNVYLEPFKAGTVVMNCIVYCLGFIVACYVAWMPTNENGILLRFDALAVMLIILLVLDELLYLPAAGGALVMCAVSLVLALLASVSLRSGRLAGRGRAVQGDPAIGRIVLGVVFGVMALLAFLVVAYATSGMKSFFGFCLKVVNACIDAVKAALLWLYGLLERFMLWLAQFASDEPMGAIGNPQMGGVVDPDLSGGDLSAVPSWIYYVLLALVAALIIFVIFRLRHLRVGRVQPRRTVIQLQRRESRCKKALLDLLRRVLSALRFRWNCLCYRKSAPGLLAFCEKRVEPALRRWGGESGESFLRRLSCCGYAPELSEALSRLADSVERSFYSPRPVTVPTDVYKTIKHGSFNAEKTDVN